MDVQVRRCSACFGEHEKRQYVCLGCGDTFRCRSEFSTSFGVWAHQRHHTGNLIFGPEGEGPEAELLPEPVTCAPVVVGDAAMSKLMRRSTP